MGLYTQALYRDALEPFGYNIEFIQVTATKELELLADERVDGSCGRAKQIKQLTDTLNQTLQTRVPSFSANYYEVRLIQPPIPAQADGQTVTALINDNLVLESLLRKNHKTTLLRVDNEREALAALESGAAQRAILIDLDTLASGPSLKTNPDLHLTHFYSMPVHTVLLNHHSAVVELLDRRIPAVQAKLNEHPPHIRSATSGGFDRTLDMVCHIPLDSDFAKRTIRLYDQALQKLQYNLSVRYVPRKRALEELRSGRTDLDCGRLAYFQHKVQQHAIQIPVPVGTVNLHAYGLDPTINISSFADLEPSDRVVYVKGSLFIADHLQQAQVSLLASSNPVSALKLLMEGR
ncbi:MAG: hypothetical protein VXZ35_05435, partial [Pseudomonadota bacterium]|nr:hypothetical protein [Pseudomonadota bacterium]